MGFSSLLGNDRLKNNLTAAVNSGKSAHFYLISGAPGSGRKTLAKLLGAALQCEGDHKPCLSCNACRKAMAGTHPDIITVDDPDKRYVTIDLVRDACADLYIRPNEGKKKIYVFPRAQDMRTEAQNALLKSLEEPPPYGVFLLITDSPEKLLTTIRSRSVGLQLTALPEDILRSGLKKQFPDAEESAIDAAIGRSGGYLGQALALLESGTDLFQETEAFLEAFTQRDEMALARLLVPMERYKREKLIPILEQWADVLQQALVARVGGKALLPKARELGQIRDPKDVLRAIRAIQKTIEYAKGNVSCAAICGWLTWALR
ncbi:MAG: hypothetical protein IKA47_09905 [Oscillospiraceae bacterium]|nr:hypothetical protein [Oscillospiraceae bacterium]